jgi:hypothetical protein
MTKIIRDTSFTDPGRPGCPRKPGLVAGRSSNGADRDQRRHVQLRRQVGETQSFQNCFASSAACFFPWSIMFSPGLAAS